MQALDLRDNALQWETERQNRLHQSAVEQKKKQMRQDSARREAPSPAAGARGVPIALEEWLEKVNRIPDMRSALIPLEDHDDAEAWSKPFSLAKADMEPWLSYYKGYMESRLFLSSPGARDAVDAMLDYPVRALLELKQAGTNLITEPPVQINGQVEYFDIESDLRANPDPARAMAVLKSVADIHDAQLTKAVEKGRELGNLLHEALMGEGHANLIHAWTKVYQRKPNVEELHLMLTTGRVKVSVARLPQAVETKERAPRTGAGAFTARTVAEKPQEAVAPKVQPKEPSSRPETDVPGRTADPVAISTAEPQPEQSGNRRKILLHLVQAAICCAALAGVAFAF